MKIDLLPRMTPEESASHAAKMCYTSKPPKVGQMINVKENLFEVSHHTTLQHSDAYFTFQIDGIAVGDVTFGLHLVSPFYNSDQRSGRYAGKMFSNPDFEGMLTYVHKYWPEVSNLQLENIAEYLTQAVNIYQENKSAANKIATKFLKEERPFISDKMLERIAPKVAQEQLRMFIPVLFPTGLDFTVNLTALVALYESAWTPPMRAITAQMAEIVVAKYPEIAYMFDGSRRRTTTWAMAVPKKGDVSCELQPYISPMENDFVVSDEDFFIRPDAKNMHPVDKLHFLPEMMDNSVGDMKILVGMSVATMGQDQRHRTIHRGEPVFSGGFYLPPILQEMKLQGETISLMEDWIEISRKLPGTLGMILAPYGAMVEYIKKGSFNAIAHEQHKRLCWCAQEEIYYLGVLMRKKLWRRGDFIVSLFQPPCYETGKCAEGARYCGRDLKFRERGEYLKDYFPRRKV